MTTAEQHTEPLRGSEGDTAVWDIEAVRGNPATNFVAQAKNPGWQFRVNTANWAGREGGRKCGISRWRPITTAL